MALNSWVARFVVDHGRVTEEGGRLRSFQRRRLDEPDVDLYVLQEPNGIKGEDLGSQALDAIGRLFLQDRLSLTGALVRSLSDTHQTLLDWNRRSLPNDQVGIGVTASLVGANVVYLAQAGPGLVFHRHGGEVSRIDPGDAASMPMGEGTLDPSVRRITLDEGDMILAASPSLRRVIDGPVLHDLLTRPTDDILPELYLLTRDLENFALYAITCIDEDEEGDETIDEAHVEVAIPTPAGREPPVVSLPREPEPAPTHVESRTWAPPIAIPGPSNGATTNGHEVTGAAIGRDPVDISKPLVNLRNDRSTGRNEYARTTGPSGGINFNFSDVRLIYLAAAVAIVLIMVVFVPGLVREGRSEKLSTLLLNSQTNLQAATTETDPAQKRFRLEETRRLAAEALRLDADNPGATDLHAQATSALQAMDAVFDISPLTPITTLSRQVTGEVSVTSLTVDGGIAYMLDSAGGRVISVPVNGSAAPSIVFQEGQTYGTTPAKKPMFLAWEGDDIDGQLLILDADRKLFSMKAGATPSPVPLRKTGAWASVAGLAEYDGNLYVLDPVGSQVQRYLPAEQGFDSEPSAILSRRSELAGAVGFAIDGDIFVIFKNGKVGRYSNGDAAPFNLGGIDRPIGAAIDIAVVPTAQEVFIADSGNKRIVVAGKDGNFRRQLVSNEFTDLRAISIDASGAQLYLVIGDQLMTAPIVR